MKTNKRKEDIRALKAKHCIELVMQEAGERFEIDSANPDQWRSLVTPGLIVDIRRQMYELSRPGMEIESGDVIAWLRRRFSWSFTMAIDYLKKRAPDPKSKTQPAKIEKRKSKQIQQNDFATINHIYTNPENGSRSYGVTYNYDLMDDFQKCAVDIVGNWVTKYFTNSSDELWRTMEDCPHHFKKIIDFEINKCANCETPFDWKDPAIFAFAEEEKKYLDIISDDENAEYMRTDEDIFIDTDFVICEKCLRGKYAPRYKALRLAWRSALNREETEREEQRQRDHEAAIIAEREQEVEEERLNYEAEYNSVIGGRGART